MGQDNRTPEEYSDIERRIEALLFASDTPLSKARLSGLSGASSIKEVTEAIQSLTSFYKQNMRSFCIVEVAGGYQLTTLPDFAKIVSGLFKSRRKSRLSQPALETLAIIAYKQPISRIDIETIRGVNCDGVLTTLTERELITITGRGEGLGRPFLYSTTRKFLEYLGLKDFRDLPSMEELERSLEMVDLVPMPDDPLKEGSEPGGAGTGDEPEAADVVNEHSGPNGDQQEEPAGEGSESRSD